MKLDPSGYYKMLGIKIKGGPGSGNFGHSGRPGQQGGSGEGGREGVGGREGGFNDSDKADPSALPGPKAPQSGPLRIILGSEAGDTLLGRAKDRAEVDSWVARWDKWSMNNDFDTGADIVVEEGGKQYAIISPGEWEEF